MGLPIQCSLSDLHTSYPTFRSEFIESLLLKVEWPALKEAAKCLNLEQDAEQLPATAEEVSE